MTDGLFEAVSRGQSVGRVYVKRGVRAVFRAVAGKSGGDQNRLAPDEVVGFGPEIRLIFGEVVREPVIEALRLDEGTRTLAQRIQAGLNHGEAPVERGLPLDGFHECARSRVFGSHTLAVVNRDRIVGLGD